MEEMYIIEAIEVSELVLFVPLLLIPKIFRDCTLDLLHFPYMKAEVELCRIGYSHSTVHC